MLEGVKGAAYDEIVEIVADGKEKKLGRIVEINEDKAVVQVFEGTDNLSLKNTHTRLTGHPMEIGLYRISSLAEPSTVSVPRSTILVKLQQKNMQM